MSAARWTARVVRRLRALWRRDQLDRELDEEMRFHLAMEADDVARATGVPHDEAQRRARVGFGGVTRYQEEHRDARGVRWMEHTMRDLRHAARGLLRTPGFTVAAIAVLALGIGATTTVFSAVNAVLRNPAHDGLAVLLYRGFPSFSTADLRAIEEQQRSFTAVGAMRGGEAAFRADGDPERVRVARVTTGFFRVLGIAPVAGRLIESRDEPVGADPVAVVSQRLAERALGGPAAAVGRIIHVDGVAHTVIGVLPRTNELLATRAEVWPALRLAQPTRRGPFGMFMIARLAPGVTYDAATRDVAAISDRVAVQWAQGVPDLTVRYEARPLRDTALAESARMLRLFSLAVALVLLIGVANVASLMLVRAIGRGQEVSLRAVLGASRGQLVRLFVVESALISALGAAAGIAVGALGLRALAALGPSLPGLEGAGLDARAVLFAVGMALLAGLVVGAWPVVSLLGRRASGLSAGDRAIGAGRGAQALRGGFVIAQFALALPLLTVSGLLLVSFARLQRIDPGFDPRNLLTVRVSLPTGQYAESPDRAAYWARALPRVREIPGVRDAGLVSSLPPDDFGSSNNNFNLIDRPVVPGTPEPNGPWPSADAGYFSALGIPLLEGRMFTPIDTGPNPVILVSRSWAQRYYPGESPLGRTMVSGGCTECPPTTVVGVVDDVPFSGLGGPRDALYSPLAEQYSRTTFLFVRTEAAPASLAGPVREALRSVDPSVPLDDIAPMEARLYESMAAPRQWATLLGGFAAAALGLAAIGVFGMLSYLVSTRRREIGVRMALGAGRRSVVRMIVGSGLTLALAGSALGLVASVVAARTMVTSLHGVSPGDPTTLAAATVILLVVAVVACWLPARRAASIDPLVAIRHE